MRYSGFIPREKNLGCVKNFNYMFKNMQLKDIIHVNTENISALLETK